MEQSFERRIVFIVACFEKGDLQFQQRPQKFKITFDQPEQVNFENLVKKVHQKCFQKPAQETGKSSIETESSSLLRIFFKYQDLEDQDVTTIKTDEEFRVMLNQFVSHGQGGKIPISAFQDYAPSQRSNASSFVAP